MLGRALAKLDALRGLKVARRSRRLVGRARAHVVRLDAFHWLALRAPLGRLAQDGHVGVELTVALGVLDVVALAHLRALATNHDLDAQRLDDLGLARVLALPRQDAGEGVVVPGLTRR